MLCLCFVENHTSQLNDCCYLRFPRVFPWAAFDFKGTFVVKRKISTKMPIAPSSCSHRAPVEQLSHFTEQLELEAD